MLDITGGYIKIINCIDFSYTYENLQFKREEEKDESYI